MVWKSGEAEKWLFGSKVLSDLVFRFPRSTSCPCCRRARGSVGVLLQLRSTSLRSGVANGGVVDLRWFGFLSGSQRRRVRKVFPSALSPDGQSFAVCARWDPSSQLRWKLWVSSGVRVPHPLSFLFRLCSCRQVRFLFFRQWYRLCLAVVSLLLRFIPTFLRIEALLFPLQCKVTLSSALSVSGCRRFLSTHGGICSKPWTALLSYVD